MACTAVFSFTGGLCFYRIKNGRSEAMKYVKAQDILPDEVVKIIQEYIDGAFIYIPRKDGVRKAWGENSGARNHLKQRNSEIFARYQKGIAVTELAREFYLSEQSVRRVIGQEKKRISSSLHNRL